MPSYSPPQWSQTPITLHSLSAIGKLKAIRDTIAGLPVGAPLQVVDWYVEGEHPDHGAGTGSNNGSGSGTLILGTTPGSSLPNIRYVLGGSSTGKNMNTGSPTKGLRPHNESTTSHTADMVFAGIAPDGLGNDASAILPGGEGVGWLSDDNDWYTYAGNATNGQTRWSQMTLVTSQPGDQTWLIISEEILAICHRKIAANLSCCWIGGAIGIAVDAVHGENGLDGRIFGIIAPGGEKKSASFWPHASFWNIPYEQSGSFCNGGDNDNSLLRSLLMCFNPKYDGVNYTTQLYPYMKRLHNTTSITAGGLGHLTTQNGNLISLPVHYCREGGYFQYMFRLNGMGMFNDSVCRQEFYDTNDYLQAILWSRSTTAAGDALAFVNPPPAP